MIKQWIKNAGLKKISPFRMLDGWLTDDEAYALYQVCKKLPRNATVVEIGSWQGKSTYCLAKGLKRGLVHAIDPFNAAGGFDTNSEKIYRAKMGENDLLKAFLNNMETLGVSKRIVVHKGYSYEMHDQFNKIDFLFIDGDHSIEGCRSDFDLYAPKIAKGGFVAFHDFYPDRDELGPTFVIKNLILNAGEFKFYGHFDSLWVARKN